MSYDFLIFIHIVSLVLLLGVGGGSAFYKFMSDKSNNIDVIVHTNKMIVLADWLFTTPSIILQPISGIMLANLMNIPLTTPWLLVSIILYIFAGALWLLAVYLQIRMKKIASKCQRNSTSLTKEYHILVKQWIILGFFSFAAMGSIFILMVFKIF
ncbi:MAG TPA: DUF2269 domain-containing protein [Flavobacteriaceae bacterium]|nr:DUF2269 domain-containing protein [Flavobacteriaceae bacterium]